MSTNLYKTANAQISFVCEAMLEAEKDGKTFSKIALILIQRDQCNKAIATVRYFLDLPMAKVLFHDLWMNRLSAEVKEFKKFNGQEKAVSIAPKEGGYRVAIMNKEANSQERKNLFFDMPGMGARALAITVLDHLRAWEIARAMQTTPQANPNYIDDKPPWE